MVLVRQNLNSLMDVDHIIGEASLTEKLSITAGNHSFRTHEA